ncbi:leucine-rich repeat-containing protein 15-like [Penaeus chinensis]|uniref:leucine-rich repeat-containing protein 15-like n=1 Tax=Penaeus chinensis TaxID=139456 RepID=UPI001FB5E104|nr:leucine-rich repeat-containing protein 15-like [Penaeus chinensis]
MAVSLLVLWASLCAVWACPRECRCSLDERGRRGVRCEGGGMRDPVPVKDMGTDTELLVIAAPKEKPNALSLGPIFSKLRHLEEIHITWSGVPALGAHSFWGLHRLHVLNFTNNHISALMDTNFRGADALRHLDLSHNRIQSVPSAVFRHVRHLRTLTLAHNMVPELVPRMFFGLTKLERLDLSYNPLGDLQPERFTDVPDLRQLSCAGCSLMSISSTLLQSLSQLRELDLRNNRLTQIPIGVASAALPNLVSLMLDGNHLSFVERGAISGSPLVSLHLAHNRISRLEVDAFSNSSIKHLDLSYNRISHLEPGALEDILDQLHEIKLSGNSLHVDQLMSVLPNARQLRYLGLGDMGHTKLPAELLRHARHLHHLNLSANYLTALSTEVLYNAPHLYTLDLSLNSFRGLEEQLVESITAASELRTLRLEGNPWQCDQCHVGPLLRWLQDAPDQESGCDEPRVWTCLKCVSPRSVAGLQLALLPPGDLPLCPFTTPPAAAVWPTWVEPSYSVVTDEPEFPRGELSRQEDAEGGWSLQRLIEEELYLVIVVGCVVVLLLLALIVVAVVLYNRHSAFYYTYEDDPEKKEKLMKAKDSKNNNGPATKTPTKGAVDATIATIDEMTDIAGSQEVLEPGQIRKSTLSSSPALNHSPAVNHSPGTNHSPAVSASPVANHNHSQSSSPAPTQNNAHPQNHSTPAHNGRTPTQSPVPNVVQEAEGRVESPTL